MSLLLLFKGGGGGPAPPTPTGFCNIVTLLESGKTEWPRGSDHDLLIVQNELLREKIGGTAADVQDILFDGRDFRKCSDHELMICICQLLCDAPACSTTPPPTPIPVTPDYWWDAQFGVTTAAGTVTSWEDKIVGQLLTQNSGTVTVDNDFLGTGLNGLVWSGFESLTTTLPVALPQPWSSFWVIKTPSGNTSGYLMDGPGGARTAMAWSQLGNNTGLLFIFAQAALLEDSGETFDAFATLTGVYDATGKIYRNGALAISGAVGGVGVQSFNIGQHFVGGFFFVGEVAEMLLYSHNLSDTEVADLNTYFRNKYGQ